MIQSARQLVTISDCLLLRHCLPRAFVDQGDIGETPAQEDKPVVLRNLFGGFRIVDVDGTCI